MKQLNDKTKIVIKLILMLLAAFIGIVYAYQGLWVVTAISVIVIGIGILKVRYLTHKIRMDNTPNNGISG